MDFKSFTAEYFNGDAKLAIQQLLKESITDTYTYSGSKENLSHIVETMNQKALETYIKCGIAIFSKNQEYYKNGVKLMSCCQKTGMESEEISACEKNPFTGKALKSVLAFVGVFLLFVIFLVAGLKVGFLTSDNSGMVSTVFSIAVLSLLLFCTKNIRAYFSFNKAQKLIDKKEEMKPKLVFDGLFENIEDVDNEVLISDEPIEKEKEVVTVGSAAQLAEAYYKNLRSMFFCMSVFAAFILGIVWIVGGLNPEDLYMVLLLSGCLVAGLVLALKNAVNLRKIRKLKFSLVPSECLSVSEKTDKESGESNGTLIINMETYGKIKYNTRDGAHPIAVTRHYQYLTDSLKVGDKCYLLVPDNGGKICAIFPEKDFTVSQGDFVCIENGYRPVEGISLEDYEKRDIDQQFSSGELTEEEKQNIKDAEKVITEARLKIRNQLIVMIVLCVTTFFGLFFAPVSLLSALGWLVAFIPVTVIALKATFKTTKAFDKVTTKYTAYAKLNGLQGNTAARMLILLAVGIIVFVLGLLLSILSIAPK